MQPSRSMTAYRSDIAENLRRRIVAGLHLGILHPGDRLDSIRQVAAEFRADPRAIMAAYGCLATEGLVQLRKRSGVFVEAPAATREDGPLPDVAARLVDLFLGGLSQGVAPAELRRQALLCLERPKLRVACLECNHDQIYALREQVERDYGVETVAVEADSLPRGPLSPRGLNADLVLTTRFHVAEAQRLGRRLRRPVIVATLDPVFINEVRRLLASGVVWWICVDPRFAAKLPRMFPGASVKPVVLGRDLPDHIPPGAPVYATRCSAARLPADWRKRVVTVPRAFSVDTARALLVFLMRRNLQQNLAGSRI